MNPISLALHIVDEVDAIAQFADDGSLEEALVRLLGSNPLPVLPTQAETTYDSFQEVLSSLDIILTRLRLVPIATEKVIRPLAHFSADELNRLPLAHSSTQDGVAMVSYQREIPNPELSGVISRLNELRAFFQHGHSASPVTLKNLLAPEKEEDRNTEPLQEDKEKPSKK